MPVLLIHVCLRGCSRFVGFLGLKLQQLFGLTWVHGASSDLGGLVPHALAQQ